MKKNIAIAMSAMMTAGTVVPTFAAEKEVKTITIDSRTAGGEKLVIKDNQIVKEKITGDNVTLAKADRDTKIAELEKMAKETYKVIVGDKVETKAKYEIKEDEEQSIYRYSINEAGEIVDNKIVVIVKNNETKEVINYEFIGEKVYDLDVNFGQGEIEAKEATVDLANKEDYKAIAKIKYELEQNKGILKFKKNKIADKVNYTEYDIVLKVMLTDGTHAGTVTFKNVHKYDKKEMKKYEDLLALVNGDMDLYDKLPVVTGDIKGHWAKDSVLEAMSNEWVDASETFRPEDSITRAEFVKVINRAFNLKNSDKSLNPNFSDVDVDAWYFKDIKIAVKAGYINGYEDGTFKPNQVITRQEAAKIIAYVSEGKIVETVKKDVNGVPVHKDIKTTFFDDASISAWADESVNYLVNNKIVNGYIETIDGQRLSVFKPENNITRAEAVVMITRAVNN